MSTDPKVESRPALNRILDGALWAVGAGVVGFILHRIFPAEPTVVVLARDERKDEREDEREDDD